MRQEQRNATLVGTRAVRRTTTGQDEPGTQSRKFVSRNSLARFRDVLRLRLLFATTPGAHAASRHAGRRSGSKTRAGTPVRSLAAALFILALPLGVLLPSATQADVLLSNLGEGNRSTASVDSSAGGRLTQAIGFETGSPT